MKTRIQTYDEFWLFYLREHSCRACRALHYFGTGTSLVMLALAAATWSAWWLLAGLLVGYGFAWIGHFAIEKNRPASFGYPLWSFISDWRMFALALTGRLGPELKRAAASPVAVSTPSSMASVR